MSFENQCIVTMFLQIIFLTTLLVLPQTKSVDPELEEEELLALHFLKYMNQRTIDRHRRSSLAEWAYASNITKENSNFKLAVENEVAAELKQDWQEVSNFHWKTYNDPRMRRQFKFYSILGTAALPPKKFAKLNKIISEMQKIYSTARVCEYHNASNCELSLEPELTNIFSNSRDPEELKYHWTSWRNAVGPKVRDMYEEYVRLSNEAAKLNHFSDNTDYWLHDFESADFRDQIEHLWKQIKPLYNQIHAYVRHKLHEKYGDVVPEQGPIPAHLLGNMWAQTWGHLADFTLPYPGKQKQDATQEMIEQGYTPLKMFQLANDFFVSLNLTAMPESFWENSILEKPNDGRELICHASAWDMFENDVRIKQCTRITEEDLYTAHHEMGHIEYFLQYAHQPAIFRAGANSGFHEAVGDVISLSVQTPKHLQKIGLLNVTLLDEEVLLNNLFKTGLDKIVFLPFGYLMDLWRWDVFSKKINKENWNCKWWELRLKYQGIEPPVDRSEADFDPAAKYHIVADVPYIRYFVSFIIQFQFHRALCIKAGEYDPEDPNKPLHECDIYQSKEAGNLLGQMLQMGSSKPWPDAMEALTGQRTMDASGLLEYFRPLQIWLENENERNNVSTGWDADTNNRRCVLEQRKPKKLKV